MFEGRTEAVVIINNGGIRCHCGERASAVDVLLVADALSIVTSDEKEIRRTKVLQIWLSADELLSFCRQSMMVPQYPYISRNVCTSE